MLLAVHNKTNPDYHGYELYTAGATDGDWAFIPVARHRYLPACRREDLKSEQYNSAQVQP